MSAGRPGPTDSGPVVAAYVSSHGFGHAARASAVLERLLALEPTTRIELFGSTPTWFFEPALGPEGVRWRHHTDPVDVGLVQATALDEDLEASRRALEGWAPPAPARVATAARSLGEIGARAVLCDISPLGLAAARAADVPSLLVESFTWTWIYERYAELTDLGGNLAPLFESATIRLQTEPCCGAREDLPRIGPISRTFRDPRSVREVLGIPPGERFVLVTMGGVEWSFEEESKDDAKEGPLVVLVGGTDRIRSAGRRIRLPHRTPIHHPDLVAASDGVVAKLGYSTIAEVWRAGVPLAYVPRPRFPESPVLEEWVRHHLATLRVDPGDLADGSWASSLEGLLELPRGPSPPDADAPATRAAHILRAWL